MKSAPVQKYRKRNWIIIDTKTDVVDIEKSYQIQNDTTHDYHAIFPGASFTKRPKLSQLSLCVRFKPKNRLKSFSEIGPWDIMTSY